MFAVIQTNSDPNSYQKCDKNEQSFMQTDYLTFQGFESIWNFSLDFVLKSN